MSKGRMKVLNKKSDRGTYMICGPLVVRNFVNNSGIRTDRKDVFIQMSSQDYFIKFCESKITIDDIEPYLPQKMSDINAVNLEIEYRTGDWDHCEGNEQLEGRKGSYIVVHRIV